jgi:hypothetical protein
MEINDNIDFKASSLGYKDEFYSDYIEKKCDGSEERNEKIAQFFEHYYGYDIFPYIGLKDKKKRKIFLNDYLKLKNTTNEYKVYKVIFCSSAYGLEELNGDFFHFFCNLSIPFNGIEKIDEI